MIIWCIWWTYFVLYLYFLDSERSDEWKIFKYFIFFFIHNLAEKNTFTCFEFFTSQICAPQYYNIYSFYFFVIEKLTTCDFYYNILVYYDCWMLYYISSTYLLLIVWSSCGVYRVGNRTACTRTQSSVCVLWVTLPEIIHRIPGDTWFIRKRTDYTGWIIIILYWTHIIYHSSKLYACRIWYYIIIKL